MNNLRLAIYNFLVNRHPGISERYHRVHDDSHGIRRVGSWFYLLWLNLCYYVFFCRFLGERSKTNIYESVSLPVDQSESALFAEIHPELAVDIAVQELETYDVISFDVFDTLIMRPVDVPPDVFFLLGEKTGILDFRNKRMLAEYHARMHRYETHGDMEVDLLEIWEYLEEETEITAEQGAELEIRIEQALCFANPFFVQVWSELVKLGKKLIITTDMYLPEEAIRRILEISGFTEYERLYLSNNYHKNKSEGSLFEIIKNDYPGKRIIHVGDNANSDESRAKEHGLACFRYQNVHASGYQFRARDMSALIGSAYRGVVNAWLYHGGTKRSMLYEYGFIYGGLFVLGYCSCIHRYARTHGIDRILFLSRDGDILKQAQELLYPEDSLAYAYWSRKAATKLAAGLDREDYFRRFLFHKLNQKISVEEILSSMELQPLIPRLMDEEIVNAAAKRAARRFPAEVRGIHFTGLHLNDELTDRNVWLLRCMLETCWEDVLACYAEQQEAAKRYYNALIGDANRVLAVDIGWAGSGAVALALLAERKWYLQTEIIGMIAGTNTPFNAEPDASESFLQSGKLVSYLYSQRENRDLLKKHDPNADYNVYWELLLSSPTRQFTGFHLAQDPSNSLDSSNIYMPEINVCLHFGRYDDNLNGIREIQQGILDFVREYRRHFSDFPYMFDISGRDAYAPMLVAASHKEQYLKAIAAEFAFEKNVV